jgi:AmmeMemoRadiSam system protein B
MVLKFKEKVKIRAPIVEGLFYPAAAEDLKLQIEQLLEKAPNAPAEAGLIISPHAALQYAGDVAACAFKAAAKRKIKTAVIIGPQHRDHFDQIILPESQFFQTPLGTVRVNMDLVDELLTCSTRIYCNDIPHLEEHCLEIQLPFIQTLFPQADIVPVLMASQKTDTVKLLANALKLTFEKRICSTLFIVTANITSDSSSDRPAPEPDFALDLIKKKDWQGILKAAAQRQINTCGAGGIAALLSLKTFFGSKVELLMEKCSSQVAQSSENIIHYAAIAVS